jgi:hypothetical protein
MASIKQHGFALILETNFIQYHYQSRPAVIVNENFRDLRSQSAPSRFID